MGEQAPLDQVARLREVIDRLRREDPWDAEQTHRSLATYLVEETGEVLDAIETGDDADLVEELGDLLFQVAFHSAIAEQEERFTLDDVAQGITDKLVRRHPWIFAESQVPDDMHAIWEASKRAEKRRTSSLDGIADHLSVIARATKVAGRARAHQVAIELADESLTSAEVGEGIIELVLRAQAHGIDADQATRDALKALEGRIAEAEQTG